MRREMKIRTLESVIAPYRGVNPERVLGYWVKTGNRLWDPGFSVLDTRPGYPGYPVLPGYPDNPGIRIKQTK
jgi:hypothetical protein